MAGEPGTYKLVSGSGWACSRSEEHGRSDGIGAYAVHGHLDDPPGIAGPEVGPSDIAWQLLPLELGFGSGQTCWRRLDRWQKAGVFEQLHRILLAELNAAGELDWNRACVDGSHVRAKKKGGAATGPSPVDRRKTGSKHYLICDGRGTPLHGPTPSDKSYQKRPRPPEASLTSVERGSASVRPRCLNVPLTVEPAR